MNSQPSSQNGICLTLPNLGFLWVFFKYPKISNIGNPLFFPVIFTFSNRSSFTVNLLSFLAQRRCEFLHISLLLYFLDFQRIKTEGEKRPLDSAEVSIQQVPASKSILVSGLSDNTTHDAIRLHFESRRNSGGPVERVQFVPKSGSVVVVFQDPAGL